MNFRDGYLEQGQAMPKLMVRQVLSADNSAVLVGLATLIEIHSDNTTAANRTFTLTDGVVNGHELQLVMASAASTTCQLADSGNCALSAAWEPLQYDSLRLVWVSSLSKWVEVSRADN